MAHKKDERVYGYYDDHSSDYWAKEREVPLNNIGPLQRSLLDSSDFEYYENDDLYW